MNEMTQLIPLPSQTKLDPMFRKERGLDEMLKQLETSAMAEAAKHDATTEEGRKAIKSIAYSVSQSKAELDRQGLKLTEQARKEVAAVNAGRKTADEFLSSLRDRIRKPVDDYETAEKARIEKHEENLKVFALDRVRDGDTIEAIEHALNDIECVVMGDVWEEYSDAAEAMKAAAVEQWTGALDRAKKAKEDADRLAALEQEAAERRQADADRLAEEQRRTDLAAQAEAVRQSIRAFARGPEEPEKLSLNGLVMAWATIQKQLDGITIDPEWGASAVIMQEQLDDAREKALDRRERAEEKLNAEREQQRQADIKAAQEAAAAQAKIDAEEAEKRHAEELAAAQKKAADDLAAKQKAEADERAKRQADADLRDAAVRAIVLAIRDLTSQQIAEALVAGDIPHCEVSL